MDEKTCLFNPFLTVWLGGGGYHPDYLQFIIVLDYSFGENTLKGHVRWWGGRRNPMEAVLLWSHLFTCLSVGPLILFTHCPYYTHCTQFVLNRLSPSSWHCRATPTSFVDPGLDVSRLTDFSLLNAVYSSLYIVKSTLFTIKSSVPGSTVDNIECIVSSIIRRCAVWCGGWQLLEMNYSLQPPVLNTADILHI